MKRHAKLKLAIIFFLFKTYFSVAKISGEILASVWLEEGNFQAYYIVHYLAVLCKFLGDF